MEEIYDSQLFTSRYDKDTNCAVLVFKEHIEREQYRTPLMNVAEVIRKHNSADLVVDRSSIDIVNENDRKWLSRVFLPALERSGCKRVFIVMPEKENDDDYPCGALGSKFALVKVSSVDEALEKVLQEKESGPSPEILAMTKKQAREYMGLPSDANDYLIDEKFWQLSKRYRKANDPESIQKLNDLSAAYDIATGRRDQRAKAEKIREQKKKFLGKTSDEWKNYFSYTWYKYLIGLIILVSAINIGYNMIVKPRTDSGIVSIGHFILEGDYYETLLTEKMDYKNPYVNCVDYVVPNDQGEVNGAYSEQMATACFYCYPNVVVFDIETYPYYYEYLVDMSDIYEELRAELSPEAFSKITPVYCSEVDYMELLNEYNIKNGIEDSVVEDLSGYSSEQIMIGLMVRDEDFYRRLGYQNCWPKTAPSLVFTVYDQSRDLAASKEMILLIFSDLA